MGWNDHVDYRLRECLDCGQEDIWEYWDDVALARSEVYDNLLGTDVRKHARCPNCGSTKGVDTDDADEW